MTPRKVLFVCLGNSCRSQMAEGFAGAYGKDVIAAQSAGLAPAAIISTLTREVMLEKNIRLEGHFPKSVEEISLSNFDLIVDMSGFGVPFGTQAPVRMWRVDDPIGMESATFRRVRDEIERLVMSLILEYRREQKARKAADV